MLFLVNSVTPTISFTCVIGIDHVTIVITRYHVSIFYSGNRTAIHFRQKLGIRFLNETSLNSENSLEVSLLIGSN